LEDAADVVGVDVHMDNVRTLRDRVKGRRNLAVADADGEDHVHLFEGVLGGAGALRPVAPADGQRVAFAEDALPGNTGGDRRLQHFGNVRQGGTVVHATHAGVDADLQAALTQQTQGALESAFVERHVAGGNWRTFIFAGVDQEIVGHDDGG